MGCLRAATASAASLGVGGRPTSIEPFDFPTFQSDAYDDIRNSGPDSADPFLVFNCWPSTPHSGVVTNRNDQISAH